LRFGTKIFPGEITGVFVPRPGNEPVEVSTTLSAFKDSESQARHALLASASDELIKTIVEFDINTLNGNHKLFKHEKIKLIKNKNYLRALVNRKMSFIPKRKFENSERRVYCSFAYNYFIKSNRKSD
jgi:hypothetical protein